ncbi:hypothetical protein [Acetobacter pasteurianus]|uniref:hypothetical protein n=1 Tax=Acetobacter pasteurianus TaxID=438 RepID=UPI001363052C|nr:hypothetical protein [Acetobacter pasteurianus]QHM90126.1 hypothetical protein FCN51_00585 [Acetobacter pasteurianus]
MRKYLLLASFISGLTFFGVVEEGSAYAETTSTSYWGDGKSSAAMATATDCPPEVASLMNARSRQSIDAYGNLAQNLYTPLEEGGYQTISCLKQLLNTVPFINGLQFTSISQLLEQLGNSVCNALQTKVSDAEGEITSNMSNAMSGASGGYQLMPGVNISGVSGNLSFSEGGTSEQNDAISGIISSDTNGSLFSNTARYPIQSFNNAFSTNSY